MNIVHSAVDARPASASGKFCVAIGFFDGVHLGHQQIIRQTISDARQHEATVVVLTFDQHPNTIVAPNRVPPLVYSLSQKLRVIASQGVDNLLLIHFDKTFSEQPADSFIRGLYRDLGKIQSICVGSNFVFGYNRGGNVELLKKLGKELGFSVHDVAAVSLDGQAVSSTRVRAAIQSGALDQASQMLGRAYSICGEVVHGDGLGRKLGFPTANLEVEGICLPPKGVYAIHADNGEKSWRAVLNIGTRPTLNNPKPKLQVEAHLLDFDGNLYERELELIFVEKLRDEKKFASLDDLRAQIAQDIVEAAKKF